MARPFLVRVADLLRDPGSRRDVDTVGPLEELVTTASKATSDVAVAGVVEGMAGGVVVDVQVGVDWAGPCRRCLDEVHGRLDLRVREIAQPEPLDDEVYQIEGDLLDLGPLAREVILSGLPVAPLCRDDCPGPAPDQFPTLVEAPPPEEEPEAPPADPRWAGLEALDFDA